MPSEAAAEGMQEFIASVMTDIVPTTMAAAAVVVAALCPKGSHRGGPIENWTPAVARPGDLIETFTSRPNSAREEFWNFFGWNFLAPKKRGPTLCLFPNRGPNFPD
jgi:hypothetical protein